MIGNYLTHETGSHKKQNSDREPQPFAPTSGSNEILQISIVHNTFLVTSIKLYFNKIKLMKKKTSELMSYYTMK